jgi:D-cysteine desulfhydrase family pyridoxal phosphate-dependent enzyme
MTSRLEDVLDRYPRISLTRTPTPLDALPHLGERLGLKVFIKRDDLTDLTLGGDKPRKLEYEIAKAIAQGADTLVTCGSAQSNHARLTTAAARKVGMQSVVALSRTEHLALQGNLLTVYLMGARVHIFDVEDHWGLEKHALSLCETLRAEGHKPYYIPLSGTTPESCLGYVRCGLELVGQIAEQGLRLDAIYAPFGTGGIFTSLLLALREKGVNCPLIGISVNRAREQCYESMEKWWSELCRLLERDAGRDRGEIEIDDGFVGRGYGDATEGCLDAILLLAQSEGILLDPVYSGKVAAGFLGHQAVGRWSPGQQILLVHSGGVPALFAYHREIQAHLIKRGLYVE